MWIKQETKTTRSKNCSYWDRYWNIRWETPWATFEKNSIWTRRHCSIIKILRNQLKFYKHVAYNKINLVSTNLRKRRTPKWSNHLRTCERTSALQPTISPEIWSTNSDNLFSFDNCRRAMSRIFRFYRSLLKRRRKRKTIIKMVKIRRRCRQFLPSKDWRNKKVVRHRTRLTTLRTSTRETMPTQICCRYSSRKCPRKITRVRPRSAPV